MHSSVQLLRSALYRNSREVYSLGATAVLLPVTLPIVQGPATSTFVEIKAWSQALEVAWLMSYAG